MLKVRRLLGRRWLFIALTFTLLAACKVEQSIPSGSNDPMPPLDGSRVQLALTGYNYTNQAISRFSVNGQGGGNVHVSSVNGGGGGTVCCIGWTVGATQRTATVRWETDSCHYNERKGSDGIVFSDLFYYFKEIEVPVDTSAAQNPGTMEVHFYPGERVEVAVTSNSSPPRLQLSADREMKRPRKLCPGGKRPPREKATEATG